MSNRTLKRVVSLGLLSAVAGCTVGPNYQAPDVKVPGAYGSAPTGKVATTQAASVIGASTQGAATTRNSGSTIADLVLWWKSFQDPQLDSLIARGVQNNLDVRLADARLRQARAQLGIAESAFYPTVDANASGTRGRNSMGAASGSRGSVHIRKGSTPTTPVTGSSNNGSFVSGGPVETTNYRAGFDASWEIDVFGGTRRDVEAGRADIGAASEDRHAVITSLLAEIAQNYITLRGVQQQIRIALDNIDSQRKTLSLNEARFQAGINSEFDVARARAQVASFEATIPALRIQESAAIHRLGVLLGEAPTALSDELKPPKTIPMSLPTIPVGLPSELLRRRPDIRAAERRLAAQTARIGVATSDLFPRFSLTGSMGTSAGRIPRLGDSRALFWSVGPAVSWNVFDAGRIRSNIQVQNELQAQTLATYESTILTSLEEVENAVVSYTRNVERRQALQRSVEANSRSVDLATGRYAGGQGIGDLLDVLVAQRDLFGAEDALVQSETQLSTNLVAVYKALGGGWETFEEQPPAARADAR